MKNLIEPSIGKLLNLSGKTAIVTGGAMGIGRAICYRLAEAGAAVLITDINLEKAQECANAIIKGGGKATALKADVSSVDDTESVMKTAISEFGSIDILVNNAGIYPMVPVLEMSESLWDKVIAINLKGTFIHSQAAAKKMKELGKSGKIINIASIDGLHPTGNLVHYDSSKGGVVMMTKALAKDLASYNITVNAIAPGGIATEGATAGGEEAMKAMTAMGMSQEQMASAFTARIPMGKMGVPDDIAKAVLFLASDLASYMTGEIIVVDGGYLLS
jgi:2-deoxy-D-gluconate 3-dehydrogenase